MEALVWIAALAAAALVALALRFYRRATQEVSLVRSGLGGTSVFLGGGGLVVPLLHSVTRVGMNTMRLDLVREGRDALVTGDRMRADVMAEVFLRVRPERAAVERAAQAFGGRTMSAEELRPLVEGRLVDALRSAAAERSMEDLHAGRRAFGGEVGALVAEAVAPSGLEVESVSITRLDQTAIEHFDPSNAFDAEGLTRLTEQIETRKRARNAIEQDTAVEIQRRALESERRRLEMERESEFARLEQRADVSVRRARQEAETAAIEAEERLRADRAALTAEREIEGSRAALEREVATLRVETASAARVAEIKGDTAAVLADLDRARRAEELEEARAAVEAARERVATAREVEAARRAKAVDLVHAEREAERDARRRRIASEAAHDLAATEAETRRIAAEAEAGARERLTEADRHAAAAAAEGQRLAHEARNALSEAHLEAELRRATVEKLPEIVAASARPLEAVDSIRIVKVDGLTRGGPPDGGVRPGGLARDLLEASLDYRAQAPLVDRLLREAGLGGLADPAIDAGRPRPPADDT